MGDDTIIRSSESKYTRVARAISTSGASTNYGQDWWCAWTCEEQKGRERSRFQRAALSNATDSASARAINYCEGPSQTFAALPNGRSRNYFFPDAAAAESEMRRLVSQRARAHCRINRAAGWLAGGAHGHAGAASPTLTRSQRMRIDRPLNQWPSLACSLRHAARLHNTQPTRGVGARANFHSLGPIYVRRRNSRPPRAGGAARAPPKLGHWSSSLCAASKSKSAPLISCPLSGLVGRISCEKFAFSGAFFAADGVDFD
jgi:hypothetical protein